MKFISIETILYMFSLQLDSKWSIKTINLIFLIVIKINNLLLFFYVYLFWIKSFFVLENENKKEYYKVWHKLIVSKKFDLSW